MRKDAKALTQPVRRRHVWKPFSVRIDEVQIDVARRVRRIDLVEEETESYFLSALRKWTELNLTIPFTEFLGLVEKKSQSLAQIVHHQQELFDVLMARISLGDELSLDALLE